MGVYIVVLYICLGDFVPFTYPSDVPNLIIALAVLNYINREAAKSLQFFEQSNRHIASTHIHTDKQTPSRAPEQRWEDVHEMMLGCCADAPLYVFAQLNKRRAYMVAYILSSSVGGTPSTRTRPHRRYRDCMYAAQIFDSHRIGVGLDADWRAHGV